MAKEEPYRTPCACGKQVTVKADGGPRAHTCNNPGGPAWPEDTAPAQPVVPMDVDETDPFVSPTAAEPQDPEAEKGPMVPAIYSGNLDCGHDVLTGDLIRADGEGGWECGDCAGDEPEHVHAYRYADDGNGHSGSFCDCGAEEDLTGPRLADQNWNGTGRPRPSASNVKLPPAEPEAPKTRLLDVLRDHTSRMTPALESAAIGVQQMADAFVSPTPQGSGPVRGSADDPQRGYLPAHREPGTPDPFSSPTVTAAPLGSATDQPQTWRNSYGQYVIKDPRTGDYKRNRSGRPQGFTRATTFAKTLIDQFGIHQWEMRTLLAGLALRPDLAAKARGLDVAADKDALQDIIAAAKDAAGGNQAATDGTDFHTVTEWIDAGRMKPEEAPEKFRPEAVAYARAMTEAGLTTKPEWIERVLFTDRVGEDVAGTADRIVLERDGTPVIADVKSGKGVDLGQREIAMQLKHYAMSVNQFGLYRKTSEPPRPGTDDLAQEGHWEPWTGPPVSEEYGIVMHVPLVRPEGTPEYCEIYRIDLRGVEPYAVEKAHHGASWVRGWRKAKGFLSPYRAPAERAPEPAPVDDVMAAWERSFRSVTSPEQANQLWQAAKDAGMDPGSIRHCVALARRALSGT